MKTYNVVVQEGLLDFGIKIPRIYNQDQKYNKENTQTVTEVMKQLLMNRAEYESIYNIKQAESVIKTGQMKAQRAKS